MSVGGWLLLLVILTTSSRALAWEWVGAPWADYGTFVAPIDAATKSRLQAIADDGADRGRVPGRMGQIGDSITESSAYFRNAIMNGVTTNETAHDYAPIRSWLAYSGLQPADANSFYRDHGKGILYGNEGGWDLGDAIAAGHPAAGVDVGDGVTPGDYAWVLIMFGTNDIDAGNWNAAVWKETYRTFAQGFIDLGVIPVLSTIPPELAHVGDGRVQAANAAAIALADEMQIPWVDYFGSILHFQPVNWVGTLIGGDGTHPSGATGGQGFSLVAQSTTDGYALRTKLTFDAAEKLRAIVFDDGPPDGAPTGAGSALDHSRMSLAVWPSPTRGETTLRYELVHPGAHSFTIVDASGRRVRAWSGTGSSPGMHEDSWDGRDESRGRVAPGVYFIVLESAGRRETARVAILH